MLYQTIVEAIFLERPNRFIAYALLNGETVTCHVKNTGRCKELLIPGVKVLLEYHKDAIASGRKTMYSLVQVYKQTAQGECLINIDSQAPNKTAFEWILSGGIGVVTDLRREVTFGDSRFDIAFTKNGIPSFMEVKGVTLEVDGIARFPDAPTTRGIKHLNGLADASQKGYQTYALFLIALKGVHRFEPNMQTHPAFGNTLTQVANNGVTVLAYDCMVTKNNMVVDQEVPVFLKHS